MSDLTNVVKFFPTANEGFSTTTSGIVTAGATTVPLNSMGSLVNGSVFVGIIQPGDATSQQVFTGTVNTTTLSITDVVWTRGNSVDHAIGSQVVDYVTGTALNMIAKGLLVQHKQDGSHSNITTDTIGVNTSITVPDSSIAQTKLTNPYKFSVYVNGESSVPGTDTKMTWNGKNFDSNNNFDISGNYHYTVPVTGYYFFHLQAEIGSAGIGTTANAFCHININGVEVRRSQQVAGSGGPGLIIRPSISDLMHCTAGDIIDTYVYCSEQRDYGGGGNRTFFSGFLVSMT